MRLQKLATLIGIVWISIFLYFGLYLAFFTPEVRVAYAASKFINSSALTQLNVTNFIPRIVGMSLDDSSPAPAGEIDLISGTFRTVFCNATVVDLNGKDDLIAINATVYFVANKSTSQNDMNEHYSNRSCYVMRTGTYNKTVSCSFRLQYFANNGTWRCNMSAWDIPIKGKSGFNSSLASAKVNPLYALAVPPVINFGELALNKTSLTDKIENVTNLGNMNIDLALHGYGGTNIQENNLSMRCNLGNISVRNERVALASGFAFDSMANLSGQFANPLLVNTFNLPQRKSETQNSTKNTYWKIHVPMAGVKGQCNGTIVFGSRIDT